MPMAISFSPGRKSQRSSERCAAEVAQDPFLKDRRFPGAIEPDAESTVYSMRVVAASTPEPAPGHRRLSPLLDLFPRPLC